MPKKMPVSPLSLKEAPKMLFVSVAEPEFLMIFFGGGRVSQNRLQWGRSNLIAENSFTKPGFWEHFVDFSQENSKHTEFTKFSLVRTPDIY